MLAPNNQIVFFGNEQLSSTRFKTKAPIFSSLINAGYDIEALIIKQRPQSSRRAKSQNTVEKIADENQIQIMRVSTKDDLAHAIRSLRSRSSVLAAFGMILDRNVLEKFSDGIINIHPSLLPRHRGSTPIETAILNGDSVTGVSLMRLTERMDAGAIYAQETLALNGDESKSYLTEELSKIGAKLLADNLGRILSGELKPSDQNHQDATFTNMLSKQLSEINWNQPAEDIERQIRAYADWPGSKTAIHEHEVIITAAHCIPSNTSEASPGETHIDPEIGTIMVECSNGALCIDQLKPPGKNEMSATDFINGYLR